MPVDLAVHVDSVDGSQMAAKITGRFEIKEEEFEFTAIAFGRIGGQNVGATLSDTVTARLRELGHDPDEVVMELQSSLLRGDLTIPEGITKESFADG